jgi:hypothetical protein
MGALVVGGNQGTSVRIPMRMDNREDADANGQP